MKIDSAKHNNSNNEQQIVGYALSTVYENLFEHMLKAISANDCTSKADAHIALCVKYALANGCKEKSVFNCYETDDLDDYSYSDFYLFREHTRRLTDYLDEKLNWDMKAETINAKLISKTVYLFNVICDEYKFKKDLSAMKIPGAKLIQIDFFYHNAKEVERSEYATVGIVIDEDNEGQLFEIGDRKIGDDQVFFNFMPDDTIKGDHGEFFVTDFSVIEENPTAVPPAHRM